MSVDRGFVDDNSKSRAAVKDLVARLSDADLARPMPAGWTVAAVLGHVAFWDQRILVLLEAWGRNEALPPGARAEDVNWINDAGKPFLLALPPRQGAEVALAIAEAVDRKIEALTDADLTRLAAAGNPINLHRAEHRRAHLDEIAAALRR
jgi:Mycothiol maleylpyruvate isomerase N-terminal domain